MKLLRNFVILAVLGLGGFAVVIGWNLDRGAKAFEAGNFEMAIVEWMPVAESGNAIFQYNLGLAYAKLENFTEAVRWYQQAAEQDFGPAQVSLGVIYALGQGVAQSDAKALKWYRLAAQQGNARGQANLAGRYYDGRGVSQDYAQAAKWMRLSAEQGFDIAQYNLGQMYYSGDGLPQDYGEAVRWYKLAAMQDHVSAQYNLGVSYWSGKGNIQSPVLAHMWLNIASGNGHPQSAKSRDDLASTMTKADISKAHEMAGECVRSSFQNCDG